MSPPVTTASPNFEIPKPDCSSTQNLNYSGSFSFSSGSTDAAGFNYSKSGPEKSNVFSRSRPRLMKIRRKKMATSEDGKSVRTDLGLNGFSDVGGGIKLDGKLGSGVGGSNGNSGSNGSAKSGDVNGNMEQHGNGLGFGASLNDSSFGLGLGNGKSVFGSSMNSSTSCSHLKGGDFLFASSKGNSNLDMQKETGSFVFEAHKSCSMLNQNLGQSKVKEFHVSENFDFVFGWDKYYSGAYGKLDKQDSNKSSLHVNVNEVGKVNNPNFVFGASKNATPVINPDSQKQDSGKNVDKTESDGNAGKTVPDMRGKVKLDASGNSEKVCHSSFQFQFNSRDSSSKNHVNFAFASSNCDSKLRADLDNNPTGKFTNSCKENASIGIQFQNACLNDVFLFGGLKDKGVGFSSGGGTKPVDEMNHLNRGKGEDCNGFEQHNHNTASDTKFKFQNSSSSGGSFEKCPAFSISNEMKKLNIGDSKVDAEKTKSFTSNFTVNTNNVFVFGVDQKNSSFMKENHPTNMSEKTPDVSHFSQSNSESKRISSSMFPSVGNGIQLNGDFCEAPSVNKDEKDSISFTSKLGGLDSSAAEFGTPNMTFAFPKYNLFPGTNSKSWVGKRLKKKNGKLKQRTMVQQLFGQDSVSKEGSCQQNHESPGCGSPMDFSPYQEDTSATNASDADIPGVKVEFYSKMKDTLEHCEKHHNGESNSSLRPSVPTQDGLSTVRRQYKKKYRSKVGSDHTVQGNDSDKDNTKQDQIGATTHEICEHWRIRGNQAYHAGTLSEAEEFYTTGINSVPQLSSLGHSMKPLLLCYSNRAATRMSLGRMREAIGDCTKAAELDPNFLKVTLRAGNCYLVLGEAEHAIQCYSKCLSLGTDVCLDRRITIEAADGLQKAKRVAEYMDQSAKLLQEGTEDGARSALGNIEEALLISRYSERLLEMKGEALCILRMYDETIQLCEQTLDSANRNFGADHLDDHSCKSSQVKLWRWQLQTKSHYRLGRLDLALDLIEKQEKMPLTSKSGDVAAESSIALAATIRELLCLKKSGNEAFNSGRYSEAVENYTAAISKSFESRPFMAICFCNRAAAYQSMNQIVDAIADCSLAITLDENYQKAISRRATLHEMIRDYKQAAYDLQRLISLLRSQSQTKTQQYDSQSRSGGGSVRDLRKARRRLSSIEEKVKKEGSLDFYLILGVKTSDAESEIKKAYRKAALKHHPDKAGQVLVRSDVGDDGTLWKQLGEKIHEDADRLFKIIGEAYAVLSDPSKRSKYDSEEEMRNIYRDSNRNSSSGCPSTSYSSPYDRGNSSGRQSGFSTPFERNNSRRYWYEARSYSSSHSGW